MIDDDMKQHFEKRTKEHINRVIKNCLFLQKKFKDIGNELMSQVINHDESKFSEPEYTPYLHITHKYKLSAEGVTYEPPSGMIEKMHEATVHHVTNNKHHPEYWDDGFDENSLSSEDRDGIPEKMVDGTKMDRVCIAEMCCDWVSMSQERSNSNSAHKWAEQNINKRWKFTDDQVSWINEFLDFLSTQK